MQVSADRKSDTGKENVAKGVHSGQKTSRKKPRNSLLLRPVSMYDFKVILLYI